MQNKQKNEVNLSDIWNYPVLNLRADSRRCLGVCYNFKHGFLYDYYRNSRFYLRIIRKKSQYP